MDIRSRLYTRHVCKYRLIKKGEIDLENSCNYLIDAAQVEEMVEEMIEEIKDEVKDTYKERIIKELEEKLKNI